MSTQPGRPDGVFPLFFTSGGVYGAHGGLVYGFQAVSFDQKEKNLFFLSSYEDSRPDSRRFRRIDLLTAGPGGQDQEGGQRSLPASSYRTDRSVVRSASLLPSTPPSQSFKFNLLTFAGRFPSLSDSGN
jgi:hypothetical protein